MRTERCATVTLFVLGVLVPFAVADPLGRRYEPTWESLDARATPQWFGDAKFGVFLCWGLYSVPAWTPRGHYAEWYQYWLQQKSFEGQVAEFHARTYGSDFEFRDFCMKSFIICIV